ncbi:MAG: molybdate ABC transporter substrate-binding protein [Campylobacter sp.]|nr:molybdate ABC transporter substrate-binding protein [Campylobacter sp.]
MKKILFFAILASFVFGDESLFIGAGGGFKKPVSAIVQNLEKGGVKVEASYAHLAQLVAMAKQGDMALIVGDEDFLRKSDLKILGYEKIGSAKLAFVTPKGKSIKNINEITKFERIAMPDAKKAIYGIRAKEFLQNAKLADKVGEKLMVLNGVPQVVAHVLNGDVDGGFINSSEVLAHLDEFGSVIWVDEKMYSPAIISVAKLEKCENNELCEKVLKELKSENSQKIFKKFGLE